MSTNQKTSSTSASFHKADSTPVLQRACACGQHSHGEGECAECKKRREGALQRAAAGPAQGVAPPIVHEELRAPGLPLDGRTRAAMEPRFGRDFSQVRVHTGPRAAESARAVNALAYTVGDHIAFGQGRYQPASAAGQRLLAHELTHVAQQSLAPVPASLAIGDPASPAEREAALAGQSQGAVSPTRLAAPLLSRQEGEELVGGGALPRSPDEAPMPSTDTPRSGPDCSRNGTSLPLSNTAFSGERGFAYLPENGYPGPGGFLVRQSTVRIRISAQWQEQIPDASQRPADQRGRRADSPQYYLSFSGWADSCERGGAGSPASSIRSGDLALGREHTLTFQSLRPGRYGLAIAPSTAAAEPNRVLVGTCEIT